MRRVLALIGWIAIAACATVAPVRAAETTDAILRRVTEDFLIPRYAMLATSAERLEASIGDICAAPTPDHIEAARDAYRLTADAWSRLEFVRAGPVEDDSRYERINFWPDRRSATSRTVAALLAGSGMEGLSPAEMKAASVAGQGLSALERVLFGEASDARLLAKTSQGRRACAVARAMATQVGSTTREVSDRWDKLTGDAMMRDPVLAREMVARLLTDMLAEFHFIVDTKLRTPLGRDSGTARPEAAEGWRSGRTIGAMAMNLAGINEMTRALADDSDPRVADFLEAVTTAQAMAEDLPSLEEDEDSAEARVPADRFIAAVRRAQVKGYEELPTVVGVPLGFNALDGD